MIKVELFQLFHIFKLAVDTRILGRYCGLDNISVDKDIILPKAGFFYRVHVGRGRVLYHLGVGMKKVRFSSVFHPCAPHFGGFVNGASSILDRLYRSSSTVNLT